MEGYAKLSQLMGEFPDVAVFKRYSTLNVQNILYLQARLENLEARLRQFALEDETSNAAARKLYSRDWYSLRQSVEPGAGEGNSNQWYTFLEISDVLKEYSMLLGVSREKREHNWINKRSQMQPYCNNMQFPTWTTRQNFTISKLEEWMYDSQGGNTRLVGQDRHIWFDSKLSELLVLKTIHKEDPLSKWINDCLIEWYLKLFGKEKPVSSPKDPLIGAG